MPNELAVCQLQNWHLCETNFSKQELPLPDFIPNKYYANQKWSVSNYFKNVCEETYFLQQPSKLFLGNQENLKVYMLKKQTQQYSTEEFSFINFVCHWQAQLCSSVVTVLSFSKDSYNDLSYLYP